MTGTGQPRGTAALQDALAAEHAVVYGYGVAGARLTGSARRRAERLLDRHRSSRDELAGTVRDRGAEPVAAAPTYALPFPVRTAEQARALATLLEERLAAVWADVVVDVSGDLRRLAVDRMAGAAVTAARWRGGSVPFPGLPERAG